MEYTQENPLRLVELFAGIGSQTQALKNIGVPHEVVAISEIDKYAIKSYEAIHGKANNLGDIRQIKSLPAADLWTYSFPCQDISVAGKGAGIKEGTRSGLLFEVERLLNTAAQDGTLPKYLLLENVKNLVSKRFKADFDSWLSFLGQLGYSNYWQVMNAKDYDIPQNRERVFCVSIRGKHEPFFFPQRRELILRLKDMLDEEVDERYYLKESTIRSILTSQFNARRNSGRQGDDLANTLLARDWRGPQCVQVGEMVGGKWDKMHDISRRVYEPSGLSPTVHCQGGGNTELKIVVAGQFQPVDRDYNLKGKQREEHFECRNDEISNAVLTGDRKNCVCIAAMRGRNPEDPSDRSPGKHLEQRLELGNSDVSNTLTSVQKDNLVVEGDFVARRYDDFIAEKGYIPEMFNAYNEQEVSDVAPTLTSRCSCAGGMSAVLKLEEPLQVKVATKRG